MHPSTHWSLSKMGPEEQTEEEAETSTRRLPVWPLPMTHSSFKEPTVLLGNWEGSSWPAWVGGWQRGGALVSRARRKPADR